MLCLRASERPRFCALRRPAPYESASLAPDGLEPSRLRAHPRNLPPPSESRLFHRKECGVRENHCPLECRRTPEESLARRASRPSSAPDAQSAQLAFASTCSLASRSKRFLWAAVPPEFRWLA